MTETLVDSWLATAAEVGDRPIVYHFDTVIPARTVRAQANALAAHFQALGLRTDDRVAVCLQNDPHWLTALLAAWQAGLTVVLLNPMMRQPELKSCLLDSAARVLVTSAGYLGEVAGGVLAQVPLTEVIIAQGEPPQLDVMAGVPVRDVDAVFAEFGEAPDIHVPRTGSDIALLTYTSGTTGPPKGAMNTHANLLHSATILTSWYGLDASDEVEEVLFQHPAVHEAAVVGRPDAYRGETVAAYIVLRPGQSVTAGELTEFCSIRMAAYKRPRSFEFVSDLPKTLTGKVLRRTLRNDSQDSP